jgi:hypothetical protein
VVPGPLRRAPGLHRELPHRPAHPREGFHHRHLPRWHRALHLGDRRRWGARLHPRFDEGAQGVDRNAAARLLRLPGHVPEDRPAPGGPAADAPGPAGSDR